jgi:RsiW-degrading membrane proteinase PrsW (M82 family)
LAGAEPVSGGFAVASAGAEPALAGAEPGSGGFAAVGYPGVVLPDAPPVPDDPMAAPARRGAGWRRWLPLAGVIGFIAACAITMLVILGFSNGPVGLAVGLGAAILPVPVLVGCFLWLDRYEPEPIRYLIFCFAWGSAVATLVALGVNSLAAWGFDKIGLPEALVAVLVAPFIEESMKTLGPILLLWRRRREWSGITDGIVYCGLSALGFAMVENVLYLGGHGYAAGADQYGPATGIQNVFLIFIVRILFTGFAHPLFTSMAGIGLGLASRSADRRMKWLAPIAGLVLAMILHGTFNLLPTLSVATGETLIMLYGYLGFMVPLFFAVAGFAIALRAWEGRLTERILPHYISAGWLSPPEVATLGSLARRHSARRWAKRVAGDAGIRAMRGFQFAATQLALLRDGMQRGLDRKPEDLQHTAEEEQRLLTAIMGYRLAFVGRDPQAPKAFWTGANYQIAFPDGVTRTVNAPEEPVVPVPVRLPAYPVPVGVGGGPNYGSAGYGPAGYGPAGYGTAGYGAVGYGEPAYGPPGYAQPGSGQPAYGVPGSVQPAGGGQPAYGVPGYAQPAVRPAGYGPAGYGPGAVGPAGYGQPVSGPAGYGPGAVGPAGHGQPVSGPAAYGPTTGPESYGQSPTGQWGYGPAGPDQAAYGSTPGQPGAASAGGPGASTSSYPAPAPGYGPPPGYGPTAGYGAPGYGPTPGYGAPGYGPPPGYGAPANGTPAGQPQVRSGVPAEGDTWSSYTREGYAAANPPAQPQPSYPQPSGTIPAGQYPAGGYTLPPTYASPAPAQPASAQPASAQPVSAQPAPGQPTPGQPTPGQPTPGQPTPGQPAHEPATPDRQTFGQAAPGQQAWEQPASGQAPPDHPAPDRSAPRQSASADSGQGHDQQHSAADPASPDEPR